MVSLFEGKERVYLSIYYISLASENYDTNVELYPEQLLNGLEYTHMPSYKLQLRVGVLIILLKKLNKGEGIVEGTPLVIKQLGEEKITAEVMIVAGAGKK
ncbi:hypothetical protein MKX01_011891 [Papaver californicum]|nr:hypothetical protein MKX01_011891 [Papaver californicum]